MLDLVALGDHFSRPRLAIHGAGDGFLCCAIIEFLNLLIVGCLPVDENADTDEEIVRPHPEE
jgi:hypothetical protein